MIWTNDPMIINSAFSYRTEFSVCASRSSIGLTLPDAEHLLYLSLSSRSHSCIAFRNPSNEAPSGKARTGSKFGSVLTF